MIWAPYMMSYSVAGAGAGGNDESSSREDGAIPAHLPAREERYMSQRPVGSQHTKKPDSPNNRSAWILLSIFLLTQCMFYIYFEWRLLQKDDQTYGFGLFYGLVELISLLVFSILVLIALFKRKYARAAINCIVVAYCLINIFLAPLVISSDLKVKAHLFAVFPHLCARRAPPNAKAFICYSHNLRDTRSALVFNPGDEMSKPSTQWPDEIRYQATGFDSNTMRLLNDCDVRNTHLVVSHIYLTIEDCWKK